MTNATRQRLLDAAMACRAIRRYAADLDREDDKANELVRDAVERRLAIIGEAPNRAAQLDPSLGDRLPDLRRVVAPRNRVVPAYDAVDAEIVWGIAQSRLPLLQARIERLLGDEPERLG